MKEGWTYKKLGEVCDNINGLWKGKKPPYINVGVIRNANFTKDFKIRYDNIEYLDVEERQYSKRKLLKGDLIIEKSGGGEKQPVGRAVLFDKEEGEFSFSNFTSVLRIKNDQELSSRYLYIYLYYIYKRGDTLSMQKATTGIHNIEFDKYLGIEVPYLSISEQQRIVSRLDSAFSHIDELKANAEKQLSEARALFQKSLAKALEPKEDWKFYHLQDICTDVVDCPHTTPRKVDKPTIYPCIRTSELRGGQIDWKTMQYLDEEEYKKRTTRIIPKENDIVYGREGTYGDAALLPKGYCFSLGQRTMLLRPNVDLVYPEFLLNMLISTHVYEQAKAKNSGCGVGHVNVKDIKVFKIYIPPLSEQQRIVERLDALSALVRELEVNQKKIISECDALKQALLRKVFE